MINCTHTAPRSAANSIAASAAVLAALLTLTACTGATDGRDGPAVADSLPGAPAPGAVPVDYPTLRASVCDTINNSLRCARAIERTQLPEAPGAERRGDTLRLTVETGEPIQLVDREGSDSDVVLYSYQTQWPDPGLVLVQVQYYEGSEYLLVDTRTGERTRLPDWPLRAPDGQRFAVLSFDLEAGYGPNTLQIWEIGADGPALAWSVEPDDWGPAEGRWDNASTLRFVRRGYCPDPEGPGRNMCEAPARVTLTAGEWRLETDD